MKSEGRFDGRRQCQFCNASAFAGSKVSLASSSWLPGTSTSPIATSHETAFVDGDSARRRDLDRTICPSLPLLLNTSGTPKCAMAAVEGILAEFSLMEGRGRLREREATGESGSLTRC